jgi:hypothetical protein
MARPVRLWEDSAFAKDKEVTKMVRTCALTMGLVVLWGSACAAQQGYETMAPIGLTDGSLTMTALSLDPVSLNETLAGVQAQLTVFEQCNFETGLPPMIMPSWGGALDLGQIQSQQMMTTIDLGNLLSLSGGQPAGTTLPMTGLTISLPDMSQLQSMSGLQ